MLRKRENLKEINGVKDMREWMGEALLDRIQNLFSAKLIQAEYALPYPARAQTEVGK